MASDQYANIASIDVTMTAANALTFQNLITGVGLQTGKGMLIDQIDYLFTQAAIDELTASGDWMMAGITMSNAITDITDIADRRILHVNRLSRLDFGTAGSAQLVKAPMQNQFFPPLITADSQLFLGMDSTGLASAGRCKARIYYRFVDLTDREILELAQSFLLVS